MQPSPSPPELHFTKYPVKDNGSLALFWVGLSSHIGIYQLDFADGSAYIGQSISARSRLGAHQRRWVDTVAVRFAPCAPERLDELELAMIRYAEKTTPLRNKLLTNRPGGEIDLLVRVSPGQELVLPWERARRGAVSPTAAIVVPKVSEKRKASALLKMRNYQYLAAATSALIAGSLPSPTETQAVLWSVSALPSTNQAAGFRRLLTLSAGRLEILRVFERVTARGTTYPSVLNVSPSTSRRDLVRALARIGLGPEQLFTAPYRSVHGVQSLEISNLISLNHLLGDPVILDSVYELVITVMRQGSAPLGRFHNRLLAKDFLDRAQGMMLEK